VKPSAVERSADTLNDTLVIVIGPLLALPPSVVDVQLPLFGVIVDAP
jgi:hypothetical protein